MARSKKRSSRVRNMALMCCLFGVMLIVGTYAWFIGMQSVSVSQFDVKIAAAEGLELSMSGADNSWTENLDAKNADPYTGHRNTWAEDGLIPMSSVGDTDSTASEMILFEKGSLTATKGGYRLLASRVTYPATTDDALTKGKGYVAFDLFIRNKSGEEYYADNNVLNEEAIYLTEDSKVTVAFNGVTGSDENGIPGTGIENSIRVGFVQIGRVEQDGATQKQINDITCSDVEQNIGGKKVKTTTGICRTATIWEPNDKAHVQNAINWYEEACYERDGATVSDDASYKVGTACKTVENGTAYTTYAVAQELLVGSNVDVYDGDDYNKYTSNRMAYKDYMALDENAKKTAKLVAMDYFTDTEKAENGVKRPTFMTLAPNSVTKVRVYVWIEGQDIDNYDFSSLGKKVTVNFGFTKERFEQDEIIKNN